jgi:hypothetical protein
VKHYFQYYVYVGLFNNIATAQIVFTLASKISSGLSSFDFTYPTPDPYKYQISDWRLNLISGCLLPPADPSEADVTPYVLKIGKTLTSDQVSA